MIRLLNAIAASPGYVFLYFFAFALSVGLFLNLFFLPTFLPHLVDRSGLLLMTDSVGYHRLALVMAERISTEGWSAWQLAPQNWPMVGITAAFYVLISPDPLAMMPISAAAHALGGLCVYLIAREFTECRILAFAASLPYVLYPSATWWYSQLLKDGFYNAGALLFALGLVRVMRPQTIADPRRMAFVPVVLILAGYILLGAIRPYGMAMFQGVAYLTCLAMLTFSAIWLSRASISGRQFGAACLLAVIVVGGLHLSRSEIGEKLVSEASEIEVQGRLNIAKRHIWEDTGFLGGRIDRVFATIAGVRYAYIERRPDALSTIDRDVEFKDIPDIIAYIPRAVQISLFAPFPSMLLGEGSSDAGTLMRRATILEMAMSTVLLLGIPAFILRYWRRPEFWAVFIFSGALLVLNSLAIPNIGTLYRIRYVYYMTVIGMGVVGWATMLGYLLRQRRTPVRED